MVERVILILLGIAGLMGAYFGSKKSGWFRVVGEFPFMFIGVWLAAGSVAMIAVGVVGLN